MEIEARIPLLFKGRPRRTQADKDVFVSENRRFRIPSVSLSEMEPVLETTHAHMVFNGSRKLRRCKGAVMAHGGSVYRLIREKFDGAVDGEELFRKPFPRHISVYQAYRSGISVNDDDFRDMSDYSSPLRPLFEQLVWRLSVEQVEKRRLYGFWPPHDYAERTGAVDRRVFTHDWWARNLISLEGVYPSLHHADEAGIEYCRHAADALMERFLLADGDLYMRSGPPVYRVGRTRSVSHMAGQSPLMTVNVEIAHAPEWHDTTLTNRYFRLGERDAAFAYAEELRRAAHRVDDRDAARSADPMFRRSRVEIVDLTAPFEANIDDALFDFDSADDELFRTGCAVVSEVRRRVARRPDVAERLGVARRAAIDSAFEEVRKTDHVLATRGDPLDGLEENIDLWIRLGRHQSTYGFGELEVQEMLFSRARALMDDRPVSIMTGVVSPKPGGFGS